MQAPTCFHDGVPNPILQEADVVLHDPVAFHPANGMFDPDADGRDPTIRRCLRGREVPSTRFFLGLEDRDPILEESLEALILTDSCQVARYSPPAPPGSDPTLCLHRCGSRSTCDTSQ
jgi:hypothetical protein